MHTVFADRREAGRYLARKLLRYSGRSDVSVLALPRGGVPVGYEVALQLDAPLDVFVVRKLGVPGYRELAMGAIASGGAQVLNLELIGREKIPPAAVQEVIEHESQELERREAVYRGHRAPPEVGGKVVIVVDDGLATGASMEAAIGALRQKSPARIVVAVPVSPPEVYMEFLSTADEMVAVNTPDGFQAVGEWYESFEQLSDEDVKKLLELREHDQMAAA